MGLRIIYSLGAILIVAVIQFTVGLSGPSKFIIFNGALMGLLTYGIWRLREGESDSIWDLYLPACTTILGIMLGGAGRWLIEWSDKIANASDTDLYPYDWLALGVGTLVSVALLLFQRRRHGMRCDCCQQPLGRDPKYCPRAEHWVCPKCWHLESCRCIDCEKLRTPLLELEDDAWWSGRVGGRLRVGQCSSCRRGAVECDLRKCGDCTWPMCIHCWDMENGCCVKCHWTIPNLPESLAMYHQSVRPVRMPSFDAGSGGD